jgi:hypothetical protein
MLYKNIIYPGPPEYETEVLTFGLEATIARLDASESEIWILCFLKFQFAL